VLFSDGRANDGPSPLGLAKVLGQRGVGVYIVGMGTPVPPTDLAVMEAKGPEAVAAKDRVKGRIVYADYMPAGQAFQVRIDCEGETLWEKAFTTRQAGRQEVDYDFPIEKLVQARLGKLEKGVERSSLPLWLRVSIPVLKDEARKDNNARLLPLRVVVQPRKALLVDGRPRWEYRYVRNLFDKDEQWEVTALLADPEGKGSRWKQGDKPGAFPADTKTLFTYDFIWLGDLPAGSLVDAEMRGIADFVGKRGGALVLVDGRREGLKALAKTPLGDLLPVTWDKPAPVAKALVLASEAASPAALSLASGEEANAKVWATLPPPRWLAPVQALRGTQTLLEAEVNDGRVPVLVLRRYGAGQVLYSATDETWRWRYKVADQHQEKFWRQLVQWIAEPPFAVRDQHVSLDVGATAYRPGDAADLRVRVRDEEGKPMVNAEAWASVFCDGRKVAAVPLLADENEGGVLRGRTPALEAGRYEVRVQVKGLPEDLMRACEQFSVQPVDAGELADLACNEGLLREMATSGGGEYFREEDAGALAAKLKPLSDGRIEEQETVLWQSGWWFAAIILLLTVEWTIRKKKGML
jgi:uncharacterized membrane protein